MVRARLPFTKKFQLKFSVFSGVPTPSLLLKPQIHWIYGNGRIFAHIGNMFLKVGNQNIDRYDVKLSISLKLIRNDP